ncbi:hypothetical protein [Gordonia terrae]|uniref:hypothetical protein n=1 Tax=Gordonia terrae TaxID=2055 RepID=UPI003F6BB159
MAEGWDVVGALALSVPLYWVSGRAGLRWARRRDLIRQERELDQAARAVPDEARYGDWRGPWGEQERAGRSLVSLDVPPPPMHPPPAPTASGGVGVHDRSAASIVPLVIPPGYVGDLDPTALWILPEVVDPEFGDD